MVRQAESRLQRKIQDALRLEYPGIFVFKCWGNEHMMAGLPDLLGCWCGRFFALEVKVPAQRKSVSLRQAYVIKWIRNAGGIAEVVCSPEEAIEALGPI